MSKINPLARLYVKKLSPDNPPYQVDDTAYKRFDQRNNLTVGRSTWDEEIQSFAKRAKDTRNKLIKRGQVGYSIKDYALFLSSGVVAYRNGTAINHSNRGLTSWKKLGPELPGDADRWEGTPEEATAMVKRAAQFVGADLVGIAPLDRRWVFSHSFWNDGSHKEIVFEQAEEPVETDSQMIVPESMRWVIIMGTRMDESVISYSPSPTGCAETRITYSKMALQVAALAEFIRGLGYLAIPSMNDFGLNIPFAIDAGFGEQGRNGKLITPEFGPSVRLCKVITDLPLVRDNPIRFGVVEFCEVCEKCADECPSNSIPRGPRTWSGPSFSNNPGVFTWHLDNESCRKYWGVGNATNCTACIRSCPFTKAPGLSHELARTFISNAPILDPVFRRLDDLIGYGKQGDASRFWVKK
jgi:epoxyqueuosine reductase